MTANAIHAHHLSQIATAARQLADSLDQYARAVQQEAARQYEETGPRCGLPFAGDGPVSGQPCRRREGHPGYHEAFIRTAPDQAYSTTWVSEGRP